MKEKQRDIDR